MNPGLLGLITALCWGTGDFAARYTSRAIGPVQTLFIITGASSLGLTPLALNGDIDLLWKPTTLTLTVLSGLATAVAGSLLYKSLAQGPLGIVVPITSSYPLPIVLIVMAMGELSLTLPLAIAIAATIGGVWVVARAGNNVDYHDDHARGSLRNSILLAGSAAAVFAIAFLIIEAAVSRSGEIEVIWLSRIVECVTLGLFLISRNKLSMVPARMWLLLIVMGAIDSVGYIALFTARGAGDTAIAAVASAAYGVVTVGLARLVLKEPVKPVQWLGFVMVISGAAALTLLSS